MKPETLGWVAKAEGDWTVAVREMGSNPPVFDAVCFHAQQCSEKYLKAFLEERGTLFGKTHNLVGLLDACAGTLPELDPMRPDLARLGTFGIAARYPGEDADRPAAEASLRIAESVRKILRTKLVCP